MVGLLRLERLRRRPRHRVQRDPRGGRPDRRQPALQVRGRAGRDAAPARRPGDHPRRDEAHAGPVIYTPWCDEHGKVIDDGTIHRLADGPLPLDRRRSAAPLAAPSTPPGSTSTIDDVTERTAAVALQGPLSRAVLEAATGESFADLRYFRRAAADDRRGTARSTSAGPATPATSATSCGSTADRAVAVWERSWTAGQAYGIRPAGMLALDVVRLEAGLILLEVDYTSARHALNPEQTYSPCEIGLGRLVDLDKADVRRPARAARERAPAGRRAGWSGSSSTGTASRSCTPPRACRRRLPPTVVRAPAPVFDAAAAARSAGRRALGWSPILKKPIALASVPPAYEAIGSRLGVEWTVEGRRGRVGATVVDAAVPRPAAQARLSGAGSPTVAGGQHRRPMTRYAALDRYIEERMPAWTEELVAFCRFPSEQGELEGLRGAAALDRRPAAAARGGRRRRRAARRAGRAAARRRRDRRGPRTLNARPALRRPAGRAARPVDDATLRAGGPRRPALRPRRHRQQGRADAADLGGRGVPRDDRRRCPAGSASSSRARRNTAAGTSTRCSTCGPASDRSTGRSSRAAASTCPATRDHRRRPRHRGRRARLPDDRVRRPFEPGDGAPERPVRLSQALASMYQADGTPAVDGLEAGVLAPTPAQLAIVDATPVDVVSDLRAEFRPSGSSAGSTGPPRSGR